MKLRLSPRAEDDLDRIAAYLEPRNPQAALLVQAQLAAALRLLTEHPQSGRSIGRGVRRFAVPRQPYLIVYRIDETAGEVAIATIRHAARRPIV
ncbi:type II toxin-antitoxin system RelE/ParE family toxin [Methylorubrum sp. SB2]|uniref:type II toxin-antitoxin system RelE/ParE family toxin n=1 Tax=Methylorubrum subtropicum TaxID=3138812 RepID=UPI00313B9ED1